MRLGERSETVIDRFGGPSDFNMPWMNARADLIGAQLLLGDFSPIERTWEATWEDALASEAWERWLVSGRLAANRAELEFGLGRFDDAVTWSRRAGARDPRAPAEVRGERVDHARAGARSARGRRERDGRAPLGRRAVGRAGVAAHALAGSRRARGGGAEGVGRRRRGARP